MTVKQCRFDKVLEGKLVSGSAAWLNHYHLNNGKTFK